MNKRNHTNKRGWTKIVRKNQQFLYAIYTVNYYEMRPDVQQCSCFCIARWWHSSCRWSRNWLASSSFFAGLRVVHDLVLLVINLCIYCCCFVIRIVLLIKTELLVQCLASYSERNDYSELRQRCVFNVDLLIYFQGIVSGW